jgi:hypothetical protein
MSMGDQARLQAPTAVASQRRHGLRRLLAGGTDGNEQLTAITGAVLVVLLAVLGVTILRIGQLIWTHLFVGLVLLGPVVLKMASTGYRFMRYYTRERTYQLKGPPPPLLRLIAPGVVLMTLTVFISGIVLMFDGPARRGTPLLIHKASFILWLGLTGLHVLGHLPGMGDTLRGATRITGERGVPGASVRWLTLAGALAAGLVVAIVLIPQFGAWTAAGALHHHDH